MALYHHLVCLSGSRAGIVGLYGVAQPENKEAGRNGKIFGKRTRKTQKRHAWVRKKNL
jgi:hypothetical protein